jgi:ATP-dependent DNA ligase
MTTTPGEALPYTKIKPGMRVCMAADSLARGRVLSKHNGTKRVHVLMDGAAMTVAFADDELLVLPGDALDQIHPMLAKNVEDFKTKSAVELIADDQWALEEKYDGERQILTYVPHGTNAWGMYSADKAFSQHADFHPLFRATTRVVGKNTGTLGVNSARLPHLAGLPVPPTGATVFDCELMHFGGFQALRSIMGSDVELSLKKQEEQGAVCAILFDVLWFGGRDLRGIGFRQRRKLLESWYAEAEAFMHDHLTVPQPLAVPNPPPGVSNIRFVPVTLSPIAWDAEGKQKLLDDVLARGGEGAMLKYSHGKYTDTTLAGRRSSELLKVKPFSSDEVVIVGFEQGQGEYNGHKFGAIHFAQLVARETVAASPEMKKRMLYIGKYDFPGFKLPPFPHSDDDKVWVWMGSCSGFDEAQEAEFRADPNSYIGKAMEVKFQTRWEDTGQMRHPNFMRMRPDKNAHDCVYEAS